MRQNTAPRVAAVSALAILLGAGLGLSGVEPVATWLYVVVWYPTIVLLMAAVARSEGRDPFTSRPMFALSLFAWSAVFWFFFELINWRLGNWYYVYVPARRVERWIGIALAFATVLPAIFLSARVLEGRSVFSRVRTPPMRIVPYELLWCAGAGLLFLALPLAWPQRFFPLVWGAATLLAEPLLYRRERRWSLLGDLERGAPGRILRLLVGGAAIGLLWELYNSVARSRWIYTVPGLDELKLFEMPLLGFVGFPIFALECWSVFHLLASYGISTAEEALKAPASRRWKAATAALGVVFSLFVLRGMERRTISSFTPRLDEIPGLPDGAATRLAGLGLTPFAISGSRVSEVAARAGVEEAVAARWLEGVKLATLRGIGSAHARRLLEAGVPDIPSLAVQDPDELAGALRRTAPPGAGFLRPTTAEVREWVKAAASKAPPDFDLLITGGMVVDGTGTPGRPADVGVTADRIAAMGNLSGRTARRTVDASGLVVAPGFIDMLGWSQYTLLVDPRAVSKVTQGVTTEVVGEGWSPAPVNANTLREDSAVFAGWGLSVDWRDLDGYFGRLERTGIPINVGAFVGATTLRLYVRGHRRGALSEGELAQMTALADTAMRQGALGVSTSLIYEPGSYATTQELISLARVAGRHGGIYISHIRSEGDGITNALTEAFRIGAEAQVPVEVWHLKVSGRRNWGRMSAVLARFDSLRASGARVGANSYPYAASATGLSQALPSWMRAGGTDSLVARLRDGAARARARAEMDTPTGVLVLGVLDSTLRRYQGRRIVDIARDEGKDPRDALMDLLAADRGATGAAYFSMNEDDVTLAVAAPWVGVGSDFGATAPDGPLATMSVHPRAYGTFPRILGRYVREQRVLTLEAAVRKMTGLAAERLGLTRRGLLREGWFADITVFDPATVADRSTFESPHQTSVGIRYVMVNGRLVMDDSRLTAERPGRALRGPGSRQ